MLFAALLCQFDLLLPVAEPLAVFFATVVVAARAGDAFLEFRRQAYFRRDRVAAGVAELMIAFGKAVDNGDTLVEHEAGAFPQAFFFRHLFQIFQDAALEVIDLVETCLLYTSPSPRDS